MDDLKLVETDELWEELRSRFDGAILMAVRDTTHEEEVRYCWWSGGRTRAVGLAELCHFQLAHEAAESEVTE